MTPWDKEALAVWGDLLADEQPRSLKGVMVMAGWFSESPLKKIGTPGAIF
jgi:hypothetical protein